MGKSKPKVEVTGYRMSMHFGICAGPPDYISAIYINEKEAWAGIQDDQDTIAINKPELFGGEKKEGGAVGRVTYLPGGPSQTIPENLATKVGRTTATMPAYRGIASAWFFEREGAILNGFYWTANSPYLPGVWIKVARASTALNQEYARIFRNLSGEAVRSEVVNLNAVTNAGATFAAGIANGVTVSASPGELLRFTLPTGQTHVAWSPWGVPAAGGPNTGSANLFYVARNGSASDVTAIGDPVTDPGFNGYEAARAAFDTSYIGGGSSYTLFIFDGHPPDNSGGLSIKIDYLTEFDSNPSHIIYECLTNTDWGMGASASAIDVDSFEAAAITLYDEDFGLSMIWTQQTTIESFISEIIDHIEATLFVSPLTGLLTLKLIRDDYSITGLPEFTPDNSVVTNFQRKLWGETVNEIVVTWTNPDNEEEETVVAQDLANISAQGGIVSDGRNYYGVRVKNLAMRLAQRDLRAAATPLASCDIEVNREAWNLLPGDVVILNSPEDDIVSIVMRVGPVDYGKPGSPTVKASLVEDVFSLPLAEYTIPPDTEWEDTSEEPSPADNTLIFTLPYFVVVNEIDASILADVDYPEVFAGVLASEDGQDTSEFELIGDIVDAGGNTTTGNLGTKTIASRATLSSALDAEVTTIILSFPNRTQGNGPTVGGFMLIEGDDETDSELCLITSFGDSPAGYTMKRGVLDTVPREWPSGTPVWFFDGSMIFADSEIRSEAETVDYKILIRTSLGLLDEDDAPEVSETLTARPHLPLRPANVKVNGANGFSGTVDVVGVNPIPVTFSRRNRVTEDALVLAWDAADVTPEAGQTTTVTLTDLGGAVLHTYSGIAGTSQNVDPAHFGSEVEGYVVVSSVRDGLESLQEYQIHVLVSGAEFLFEDGQSYLFEDAQEKAFED